MSLIICKHRTSLFLIVTRTGPFCARNLTQILVLCTISLLLLPTFSFGGTTSASADRIPENGTVKNGAYNNDYFGFRYPLPAGWSDDLKGPAPSVSGYYSLVALKPEGELTATILIAAQDMFFSSPPIHNEMDFLAQMKQHLDPSLTAPSAPAAIEISGHRFARLDYHGDALNYSVFATEIRCHILIFSLASRSPEKIHALANSLNKISFALKDQTAQWPACVRDYATADHIIHRVNPALTGPRFASVPVRFVINTEGKAEHIHAIAGFPEQIKGVLDALPQWTFKPYEINGQTVAVETGLLFEFKNGQN